MIKLVKRREISRYAIVREVVIGFIAFLILLTIILSLYQFSSVEVLATIAKASFGSSRAISSTLVIAAPLLLIGLAAGLVFRLSIWNIGYEGQLYVGAIAATAVGISMPNSVPRWIAIIIMIFAGFLGGMAWALLPAWLRAKLDTNEILSTLMMNFIAGYLLTFLIFGSQSYWRDTTSPEARAYPQGKKIAENVIWPKIEFMSVQVPLGLVVGVVIAALMFAVYRYTMIGLKLRVMADSKDTGRYMGVNQTRLTMITILLSGAVAGIAGAAIIGDSALRLEPVGLQQLGYGYTGIVVAALARYSPPATVLTALLIGAVQSAGYALRGPDFPIGLTGTIQGLLLFSVIGVEFLRRYRIQFKRPRRSVRTIEDDAVPAGSDVSVTKVGG